MFNKIAKIIIRINKTWEKIIAFMLTLLVVVMIISVGLQVIGRFVLNVPFIWTSDLAVFTFIWLAFLGAAIGVKQNEHFVIDILPNSLNENKSVHFSLELLTIIIQIIIGLILLIYGYDFVEMLKSRISFALGIRLNYIAIVIPISGILIILGTLERLVTINNNSKVRLED